MHSHTPRSLNAFTDVGFGGNYDSGFADDFGGEAGVPGTSDAWGLEMASMAPIVPEKPATPPAPDPRIAALADRIKALIAANSDFKETYTTEYN